MKESQTHSPQRSRTKRSLAAASVYVLGAFLAVHQAEGQVSPPAAKPGDPTRTPPEKIEPTPAPGAPVPNAPPGSLSDTLSRQEGVITPPKGVDPEMQKAPPADGKMRVIPPPGSPGNPSNVEPK